MDLVKVSWRDRLDQRCTTVGWRLPDKDGKVVVTHQTVLTADGEIAHLGQVSEIPNEISTVRTLG